MHTPIEQQAILLQHGRDSDGARRFLQFLAASPLVGLTGAGRLLADETLDAVDLAEHLLAQFALDLVAELVPLVVLLLACEDELDRLALLAAR